MVRIRDSPTCAICEFVMKQLESMLEDHATEVGIYHKFFFLVSSIKQPCCLNSACV